MKMGPITVAMHEGRLAAAQRTGRWPWQRKESLVQLVEARLLTPKQAAERYAFSAEELEAMRERFRRNGPGSLKATKLQEMR